jgi:hypothetical protein
MIRRAMHNQDDAILSTIKVLHDHALDLEVLLDQAIKRLQSVERRVADLEARGNLPYEGG